MVIAEAATADDPNWTDILTAIGTVGAVIVAVGIALWTERRSDKRIKEERTCWEHKRGIVRLIREDEPWTP